LVSCVVNKRVDGFAKMRDDASRRIIKRGFKRNLLQIGIEVG